MGYIVISNLSHNNKEYKEGDTLADSDITSEEVAILIADGVVKRGSEQPQVAAPQQPQVGQPSAPTPDAQTPQQPQPPVNQ